MANLIPKDLNLLKQLETQMQQNPQNAQLKADYKNMLLSATTSEFVQVRELKLDQATQKMAIDCVSISQN